MILNFVKTVLDNNGTIKPLIISEELTGGTGLCNPSVYVDGDRILINIRHVLYNLYHSEFDKKNIDYMTLLQKIETTMVELNFMRTHDNAQWMQQRGADYLTNPKLFKHAPLTYLCAFLAEIFKQYDVETLPNKLSPHTLKSLLSRLNEFKPH